MSNLRKLLASDIIHGLLRQLHSDIGESSADRIAALGISDALGSLLWRLRWANDHRAFEPAVVELVRRVRRKTRLHAHHVRDVCVIALEEWLDDVCRKCGGRGHIVTPGTPHARHACPMCAASGTRRHSDVERGRRLSMDKRTYRLAEEVFAEAHMRLADADNRTGVDVATSLERIMGRGGVREKVLAMCLPRGIMKVGSGPAHKSNDMPELPDAAPSPHKTTTRPELRESC